MPFSNRSSRSSKEANMRMIKKRSATYHIGLMIALAAIAIPVAADIDATAKAIANEQHAGPVQTPSVNEGTEAKASKARKIAVFRTVPPPQDDYYDLRREHWEDRLESRLEYREEYLEGQTGDKDDDADAEDSKAGKDDDDSVDQERDIYEQRREYWRNRLDKEW